jgi:hypothetical protein
MLTEKVINEQKMVVNYPIEKIGKEQGEKVMADNELGTAIPQTDTTPSIDYESEYKKMLAERDAFKAEAEKQKGLKDKYASENAGYKKKELEKMTDDEKRAKEYQDLVESKNKMEEEIRMMRLERDLLSNGFSAEESEKLIKSNFSVSEIANIVKTRVEDAVKSAKAEAIKTDTPSSLVGNGNATGNSKSDFQRFQDEQLSKQPQKEIKFN